MDAVCAEDFFCGEVRLIGLDSEQGVVSFRIQHIAQRKCTFLFQQSSGIIQQEVRSYSENTLHIPSVEREIASITAMLLTTSEA